MSKILDKKNIIAFAIFMVALFAFVFWQFGGQGDQSSTKSTQNQTKSKGEIVVYKDKYCSCCGLWAEKFKEKGYSIKEVEVKDMAKIKSEKGVPLELASCHTAVLDGKYILEGHVPIESVLKLQKENPDIAGLAVPGMPTGVPGMPGRASFDTLQIYSFNKEGQQSVFDERGAGEIEWSFLAPPA